MKPKILLPIVIITLLAQPIFSQRIFDLKTDVFDLIANGAPNLALEIAGPKQGLEFGLSFENRQRVLFRDNFVEPEFDFFDRQLLNTLINYRFYLVKAKKWKAAGFYLGPSGLLE